MLRQAVCGGSEEQSDGMFDGYFTFVFSLRYL
jgi:hypothetical protein